ncbi:MAG: peptide deformylase [Bacteroidales bacterium]|nr:peptide deformylase [Bacteroidales bacterium]
MTQTIYLYGSDVLRKKAAEADLTKREELTALVQDLWDTLRQSDGCGLAAPQIGVSLRVLIVDGDGLADEYPYLKGFRRVMINPEIVEESDKQCEFSEGCLSVPGIYADVRRSASIRVAYWDEHFQRQEETLDRFACRMVQHEMSHLDGVLFTDLLPPIRRKILAKKLQNIAHGKVATHYHAKIK